MVDHPGQDEAGVPIRVPQKLALRIEAYAREEGLGFEDAALELMRFCIRAVDEATIDPGWERHRPSRRTGKFEDWWTA